MKELTRDEIRRACEAVGWVERDEWSMGERATWWSEPTGLGSVHFASFDEGSESALALLEATGEASFIVDYNWSGHRWFVGFPNTYQDDVLLYSAEGRGDTLPEAAVRAVLALAESRQEKP